MCSPQTGLSYSRRSGNDRRMITQSAPDDARRTLADLVGRYGESLASLSRMIGRNDAYLHQFIYRGTPQRLHEDDRLKLAQYFRVSERVLGGRDLWEP